MSAWAGLGYYSRARGEPERYPRRAAKAKRPERHGAVFVLRRGARVWQVRRPDKGLLGGMAGLPTTPWRAREWTGAEALRHAPASAAWAKSGAVRHVFTHFALTLDVYAARGPAPEQGWWGPIDALPTVFRKAASLV